MGPLVLRANAGSEDANGKQLDSLGLSLGSRPLTLKLELPRSHCDEPVRVPRSTVVFHSNRVVVLHSRE